MKKLKFKLILLFIISIFTLHAQENKLQIKEKELPQVILQDISGKKIEVADYGKSGKPTLFTFWATWCAPCKKELANLANIYEDWITAFDVKIVAVSVDDARNTGKVKSYSDGKGWEFDLLLDVNGELQRALNFQTVPFLILVNKEGKIIYSHSGYVEGDEYVLEDFMKEKL